MPPKEQLQDLIKSNPELISVLSHVQYNDNLKNQFGAQNLQVISTLAQQIMNQQPDLYEDEEQDLMAMDDFVENQDDTVYLSMHQLANSMSSGYQQKNPSKLQQDDDVIDYFLENNPEWVICEFYKRGNCKFGDKCKYMHPKSM
jgi:hypothetical protein